MVLDRNLSRDDKLSQVILDAPTPSIWSTSGGTAGPRIGRGVLTNEPDPSPTATLILVGGSRGLAIAFAEKQHFARHEWARPPAPGLLRVVNLHEQAIALAQRIRPRRPSEAFKEHRDAVVAALRERAVESVAVFGSVARGDDNGRSDIGLVVAFGNPRPKELDWVGRIMEIEQAVYAIAGFPCDVVEDTSTAERLAVDRVPLF